MRCTRSRKTCTTSTRACLVSTVSRRHCSLPPGSSCPMSFRCPLCPSCARNTCASSTWSARPCSPSHPAPSITTWECASSWSMGRGSRGSTCASISDAPRTSKRAISRRRCRSRPSGRSHASRSVPTSARCASSGAACDRRTWWRERSSVVAPRPRPLQRPLRGATRRFHRRSRSRRDASERRILKGR